MPNLETFTLTVSSRRVSWHFSGPTENDCTGGWLKYEPAIAAIIELLRFSQLPEQPGVIWPLFDLFAKRALAQYTHQLKNLAASVVKVAASTIPFDKLAH